MSIERAEIMQGTVTVLDKQRPIERLLGSGASLSFYLDLSGRLLVHGSRIASLSDLADAAASDVLIWTDIWSETDRVAAEKILEAAALSGSAEWHGRRLHASGRTTQWHVSIRRLEAARTRPARLAVSAEDVTELYNVRGALEVAQRRSDALIAAISEIVWYTDPLQQEGRSHRWKAFTGNEEAATLRHDWLELVHPDDRAATIAEVDRNVAGKRSYAKEYRLWHRSGTWRWVEDRAVPVLDRDGAVVEWVGVISDIHDRKMAENALREREERLRLAMITSEVGVWDVDLVRGTRTWSDELKNMLGLPPTTEPAEATFRARVHGDDWASVKEAHDNTFLRVESGSVGFRITRADDGRVRWMLSRGSAIFDETGRPVRRLGTIQDVTDRRRLELDLRAGQQRLNAALRAGRLVAWQRDLQSGAVTRSANALEILGLHDGTSNDFLERIPAEERHVALWDPELNARPSSSVAQFRYHHPDGRELWLETRAEITVGEDDTRHVTGITADITERKIAEAALIHAANHDPLTGLLNRIAFSVHLEQALAEAAQAGTALHLLFLDLDSLKSINDCWGHDAGDAVVTSTGSRLNAMCPPFRLVARLSGDEFAAVICDGHRSKVDDLAAELIRRISEPVIHKGRSLVVSASIGLASYPMHDATLGGLMKSADLALNSAKQTGKRRAHWFDPVMRTTLEERQKLKAEMSAALALWQIIPYYQPKLDLVTGKVVGFEALARWRHPSRGLLTPAIFGSLFDDGEMAIAIDDAILEQVLGDIRDWLALKLPIGRVAINCSSHAFRLAGFAEAILVKLSQAGVAATHFEVEVTEGVMLGRDAEAVASALDRLHRAGVKISLDDFGTGYASLVHLQKVPVDEIKLDRSFVAGMDVGSNRAIIKAIVALGLSLGLTTVAEGIETRAQADALREIGCTQGQGFLLGKPMSAGRVAWFINQQAQKGRGNRIRRTRRAAGE